MRTEAEPCFLGRSVSAHSNERRCDYLVRNPWPHVLISLPPRVVFLSLPGHHDARAGRPQFSDSRRRLLELCERDRLSPVVNLYHPVFPFADQSLASCGPIVRAPRLQLQVTPLVPEDPVLADRALCLQPKNFAQFTRCWLPPVIVLRLRRCPCKTAVVLRQILLLQIFVRRLVGGDLFPLHFLNQTILVHPVDPLYSALGFR